MNRFRPFAGNPRSLSLVTVSNSSGEISRSGSGDKPLVSHLGPSNASNGSLPPATVRKAQDPPTFVAPSPTVNALVLGAAPSGGSMRRSLLTKQVSIEGLVCSFEAIKLNSKGMPQSRVVTLTKNHLYISTPKKKCKRSIPLVNLQGVSLTAHWDSIVCVHVDDATDLLVLCPDKQDFVKALVNVYQLLTSQALPCQLVNQFEFEPRPGVIQKLAFYFPDGTERRNARIFVDWQELNGSSVNPSAGTPRPMSPVTSADLTPEASPPTSPIMTSGVFKSFLVGDGLDDADSEDEISERKVRVRGSTLLSKMMNIIPVNDKKPMKTGNLIDRMTDSSDSFVFYKWLLDPEEANSTGMKVREWQIQGGREYMEDVLSINYNLKHDLGELNISLFDGHGGRGAADWLGTNLLTVMEKFFLKQGTKDMRTCLLDSFQKAQKKLLADKDGAIGTSGSTALVAVIRYGKLFLASCGDTRAVVFQKNSHQRLTTDHRISHPQENKRLLKLGATIRDERLVCGSWDINLARSLGDRQFQPYVLAEPEYIEYRIDDDDEFLVIATDGVWDTLSEADVGRIAHQSGDPKKICSMASAMGSRDNLSAAIVFFKEAA